MVFLRSAAFVRDLCKYAAISEHKLSYYILFVVLQVSNLTEDTSQISDWQGLFRRFILLLKEY